MLKKILKRQIKYVEAQIPDRLLFNVNNIVQQRASQSSKQQTE